MQLGFATLTLKDWLDVLIVPIVIFAVGAWLPSLFDAVKARKFLALIKRELREMDPNPAKKTSGGKWHQHLTKRFIHQEIFAHVSKNRDFILSLDPEISYTTAQLWFHFENAKTSRSEEDLAEHGKSWCDYLGSLCVTFDGQCDGDLQETVYKPWKELVLEYHPNLKERKPWVCKESFLMKIRKSLSLLRAKVKMLVAPNRVRRETESHDESGRHPVDL